MKVPYFDIRSHFLMWMILSKVFSMYIDADRHFGIRSPPCMLITEARRTGGKYASITRCFLFRFSTCFKKKQWLSWRKHAAGDGNPSIFGHIFRRKHGRFQMQVSEHKMYLIFCLYKLERLRVNTNPKNWINFVRAVQLLSFSISFEIVLSVLFRLSCDHIISVLSRSAQQ